MADAATRPRRLGIRALVLALVLPGMAGLMILDTWSNQRLLERTVRQAHDRALAEPVQALSDAVRLDENGEPALDAAIDVQAMFEATHARVQALRVVARPFGFEPARGEQVLTGAAALPDPPPWPAPDRIVFYDATLNGRDLRVAAIRRRLMLDRTRGFEVLSEAAEGTQARVSVLADLRRQALQSDLRMMGLMIALITVGVGLALRPLERLRRSLAQRSPEQTDALDPTDVPHEVAPLVDALNHHLARQRAMVEAQVQFLADASHQLRTPLAIMLTQAGYALRSSDAAVQRETLTAMAGQLERTRRLCDQLLALARAGEAPPAGERVDLNALARDVVVRHLPLAHERGQDLGFIDARGEDTEAESDDFGDLDHPYGRDDEAEAAPGTPAAAAPPATLVAPVKASPNDLTEALSNLVHNALRYTPRGGQITVQVVAEDGRVRAEVVDDGPGIPATLRERAFQRFAQLANAQPPAEGRAPGGGAGLGLAIARAYVRRHGGDITLSDAQPADAHRPGLRATLELPRAS